MCALTSSRLDDFSDTVTVMITIIFFFRGRGRGSGHTGGRFFPSNTLDKTLLF